MAVCQGKAGEVSPGRQTEGFHGFFGSSKSMTVIDIILFSPMDYWLSIVNASTKKANNRVLSTTMNNENIRAMNMTNSET